MDDFTPDLAGSSLPPQNIEAEEIILGGILFDPNAMGKVVDILQPEAFYVQAHRQIYEAARHLYFQGQPIDLMTISTWLNDQNLLEKVGGNTKIISLLDRTVSAANIERYVPLITEKYIRRLLISTAKEIGELGFDTTKDLDNVLDESEQKIFSLTQARIQEGLVPISSTLLDTFTEIQAFQEKTALPGISSEFYDLDGMTGGFQRSDLIIIAARPSMGKCLSSDAEIVLDDGSIATIEEIYHRRQGKVLTLTDNWRFGLTQPSNFVDDGIKPVFRVKTKLGRCIETTLTHPYLTIQGWQKLSQLQEGDKIAAPRKLPIFGEETMPEYQVKLLAYFIGDGCLTRSCPQFTNSNPLLQQDFIESISYFEGIKVKRETSQDTRITSFIVSKNLDFIKEKRLLFAQNLTIIINNCQLTSAKIADLIGVRPSVISSWKKGIYAPNKEQLNKLCSILNIEQHQLLDSEINLINKNQKNIVTLWLESIELWGKNAHDKFIPDSIFKLSKYLVSLFLNRLFSTDGWLTVLKSNQVQLGYATVSEKLARQVQHLLLRFGVIAHLKQRSVKYKDGTNKLWQLNITDVNSIKTFIDDIGIFGKEGAINRAKKALVNKKIYRTNCDLIPLEIWKEIEFHKGDESWSSLAKRAGIKGYKNIHQGKRCLSRERLFKLAFALNNLPLQNLATSDIYWDEIVSITYMGEKQVYDLTIPETHNFVANDICVHNTSFALNIASNVAKHSNLAVAIFSLEMSREQLAMRLLSGEARVESNRLKSGRITEQEMEPLMSAMGTLAELPIYIDDTANLTVMQMRSQVRRLQAEKKGQLGLVLLDYLQLMQGGGDNRVQELSKMTRALKGLAREINAPVIALSQLSRAVEQRTNKRPMLSDLRESGSIEQDADLVLMLYRDEYYHPDSVDQGVAEVIVAKHRNGPTGLVKLLFRPELTQFLNMKRG
ncbi:replicative DNA helicase [Cyanobacterium stanieri LEGE 03274]|uniref:Replicative DNA helicase n=1 Tax=Cyanobacterium stanieri LEGE 03274 TaxID=1828756 RepID=A0ABR9V795_9CHRO|nr:replicative DNA helicase [Cyanobacterium stanieri]MBE9223381.1 replicative DNA helicase [Cyanobacterium stanieri LEGE 03274]